MVTRNKILLLIVLLLAVQPFIMFAYRRFFLRTEYEMFQEELDAIRASISERLAAEGPLEPEVIRLTPEIFEPASVSLDFALPEDAVYTHPMAQMIDIDSAGPRVHPANLVHRHTPVTLHRALPEKGVLPELIAPRELRARRSGSRLPVRENILDSPAWNDAEQVEFDWLGKEWARCSAIHDGRHIFIRFDWRDAWDKMLEYVTVADQGLPEYFRARDYTPAYRHKQHRIELAILRPDNALDFMEGRTDIAQEEAWSWMPITPDNRPFIATLNRPLKRVTAKTIGPPPSTDAPAFIPLPAEKMDALISMEEKPHYLKSFPDQPFYSFTDIRHRVLFWLHTSYAVTRDFTFVVTAQENRSKWLPSPDVKAFSRYDGDIKEDDFLVTASGEWTVIFSRPIQPPANDELPSFTPGSSIQIILPEPLRPGEKLCGGILLTIEP